MNRGFKTGWVLGVLGIFAACSPEMAKLPAAGSGTAVQGNAAAIAAAPKAEEMTPPKFPADWTLLEGGTKPALPPIPLTDLLARAAQFKGQVVRTTGTVDATCPGGCWVTVGPQLPGGPLRVKFDEPSLKVPPECKGSTLDMQGTLDQEVVPLEKARYFEQERAALAGEPPKTIDTAPTETILRATGWVLARTAPAAPAPAEGGCPHAAKAGGEPGGCPHHRGDDDLLAPPVGTH